MEPDDPADAHAGRQDPALVRRLSVVQAACLTVVGLVAATVFIGWLVPQVGSVLPVGWNVMKANSAFSLLLCAASLMLTRPTRKDSTLVAGRVCAALVVVLAATALLGHLTGRTLFLETWADADRASATPGRLSIQTASFLLFLGLALVLGGKHHTVRSAVADGLTGLAAAIPLVIIAGYSFGAANLFGQSPFTRTSPQTLLCLVLLGFSAVVQRTQHGFFAVLVGVGIGSQTARTALPFALSTPFLIVCGGAFVAASGWLSGPYAAALVAAATSLASVVLVVLVARQINALERDLRNLSLTDELTGLHNTRSFNLLGEHMFREGRRDHAPVALLYFDVVGLKAVNDLLGHDVGSRLVVEFGNLLRANFRSSDVVARVGGDEFAVVTKAGQPELMHALQRLERSTEAANLVSGRPFQVSYCVGDAVAEPTGDRSFAELLAAADAAMYEQKRRKRVARESLVAQMLRSATAPRTGLSA